MIYMYPYTSKVAGQDPGSASAAGPAPKPKPNQPSPGGSQPAAGQPAAGQGPKPGGPETKPVPAGPAAATGQPATGTGSVSGQAGPTGPAATGRPATGAESASGHGKGQSGAAESIIDPVILDEISGHLTLPILLALISALVTDKPAIPLALALAGLGAAYYIPWVKENINVARWVEALLGGSTSNAGAQGGTGSNT